MHFPMHLFFYVRYIYAHRERKKKIEALFFVETIKFWQKSVSIIFKWSHCIDFCVKCG